MNVLFVSQAVPYLPCHDGFRLIPANIIRELGRRHDIHLVARGDGSESADQLQWARPFTASITIVPPRSNGSGGGSGIGRRAAQLFATPFSELIPAVDEAFRRIRPNLVHLEGPGIAGVAGNHASTPQVLSAHDSLSLRYRQLESFAPDFQEKLRHRLIRMRAQRAERKYARMERVVVTSPFDAEALSANVHPDRISVIPNGVDLEYFAYAPEFSSDRLVFTGNMSWAPNEDAAKYFVENCFPQVRARRPKAEFWVVGANPSAAVRNLQNTDGVVVTGTVPDMRDYLRPASVYVSCLRFGAGVKNKILEAMAVGCPVVGTNTSFTGTPIKDGGHAIVADDADSIVRSVVRVLEDRALATELSRNARRLVEDEYSWSAVASRFEDLWRAAARKSAAVA